MSRKGYVAYLYVKPDGAEDIGVQEFEVQDRINGTVKVDRRHRALGYALIVDAALVFDTPVDALDAYVCKCASDVVALKSKIEFTNKYMSIALNARNRLMKEKP